jgi:hypothetical protein
MTYNGKKIQFSMLGDNTHDPNKPVRKHRDFPVSLTKAYNGTPGHDVREDAHLFEEHSRQVAQDERDYYRAKKEYEMSKSSDEMENPKNRIVNFLDDYSNFNGTIMETDDQWRERMGYKKQWDEYEERKKQLDEYEERKVDLEEFDKDPFSLPTEEQKKRMLARQDRWNTEAEEWHKNIKNLLNE